MRIFILFRGNGDFDIFYSNANTAFFESIQFALCFVVPIFGNTVPKFKPFHPDFLPKVKVGPDTC